MSSGAGVAGTIAPVRMAVETSVGKWLHTLPSHQALGSHRALAEER